MFLSSDEISKIQSISELAPLFSVSEEEFNSFLTSKNALIANKMLLKKNGEERMVVCVKDDTFRHFLKRLSDLLYHHYEPLLSESSHGFKKGSSIVTNAQQHTCKAVVMNVDIKSFYDSIGAEKIKPIFTAIGFNNEIATALTDVVTVEGVLATGFSTSPIISNAVCVSLDKEFQQFASTYGLTYTRYVDDITFSSDGFIPQKNIIKEVLKVFGFSMNENKFRLYRRGGPQYVTGLTVVDNHPRLPRKLKRNIRLELYFVKKYGVMSHLLYVLKRAGKKQIFPTKFNLFLFTGYGLSGYISFINAVEPKFAKKIRTALSVEKEKEA